MKTEYTPICEIYGEQYQAQNLDVRVVFKESTEMPLVVRAIVKYLESSSNKFREMSQKIDTVLSEFPQNNTFYKKLLPNAMNFCFSRRDYFSHK